MAVRPIEDPVPGWGGIVGRQPIEGQSMPCFICVLLEALSMDPAAVPLIRDLETMPIGW